MREDPNVPGIGPDGRPYPVHATGDADRLRGALVGLAAGDAATWGGNGSAPLAMAAAAATSLTVRGRLDLDELAGRYRDPALVPLPADASTRSALSFLRDGEDPRRSGRSAFGSLGRRSPGADALVRAVPVALFFGAHREDRLRAALDEADVTHHEPMVRLAAAALAGALASAVTAGASPREMAAAAVRDLDEAAALLLRLVPDEEAQVRVAHATLRGDLAAAGRIPGASRPVGERPAAREVLHDAFARLLAGTAAGTAPEPSTDETDEVAARAAVTGALLGASRGEAEIPADWRETARSRAPGLAGLLGLVAPPLGGT